VHCLASLPDQNVLISGSEDKTVKFWTIEGKPLGTIKGFGPVYALKVSPNGKTLAIGHCFTPGNVMLWDLEWNRAKGETESHAAMIRNLAFSPDNKTLAAVCGRFFSKGGELKLHNLE